MIISRLKHYTLPKVTPTTYVFGSGPSLLDWPRDRPPDGSAFFCNSSVHHFSRLNPGACRVIADYAAIYEYLNCTYYLQMGITKPPAIPTYVPELMYEMAMKDPKAQELLAPIPYILYDRIRVNHQEHPLLDGGIWKPTLLASIGLAMASGAKEIHLIGVDYGCVDGVSHWDKNIKEAETDRNGEDQRAKIKKWVLPRLEARGVKLRRFSAPGIEVEVV